MNITSHILNIQAETHRYIRRKLYLRRKSKITFFRECTIYVSRILISKFIIHHHIIP